MGSKSKSSKSKGDGHKSDSSRKSRSSSKSRSDGKSKKSRSKSRDGNKSDSSAKSRKDKKSKEKVEGGSSAMLKDTPPPASLSASMEFEAGMLFSKFDQTSSGLLDKSAFVQLYKEIDKKKASSERGPEKLGAPPIPPSFQAGQMFERYSGSGNGQPGDEERKMSIADFERFVAANIGESGSQKGVRFSDGSNRSAGGRQLPSGFQAGQLFERFGVRVSPHSPTHHSRSIINATRSLARTRQSHPLRLPAAAGQGQGRNRKGRV